MLMVYSRSAQGLAVSQQTPGCFLRRHLRGIVNLARLAIDAVAVAIRRASQSFVRALTTQRRKAPPSPRAEKQGGVQEAGRAGLTMIFPTMYGWIVQIYGYSPGAAKVWEKVSSVSSAADLKVPFLSPIRCGLSSSFFQVTVVPAVTVRVAGVKAKLSISTVAGLAAACDHRLARRSELGQSGSQQRGHPDRAEQQADTPAPRRRINGRQHGSTSQATSVLSIRAGAPLPRT